MPYYTTTDEAIQVLDCRTEPKIERAAFRLWEGAAAEAEVAAAAAVLFDPR